MDIDSKRTNSIAKYRLGWKVTEICRSEGISRMTFYRWLGKYNKRGNSGLVKKSTRPRKIHYKLTDDTKGRIIQLRGNNLNEYAIQRVLRKDGTDVGHTTVYKILKDNGLIKQLPSSRKQRAYIRFERKHPNSMWQTDLTSWKRKVLIAYIDDYSRFITGAGTFRHGYARNVLGVFRSAIREYGKPKDVLTDHGSQFYSMKGESSGFDSFCGKKGIRHILCGVGRPTTNGKIERWFGTFKMQVDSFGSVGDYVKYYNYERPHRSLGYITPAERYFEKV